MVSVTSTLHFRDTLHFTITTTTTTMTTPTTKPLRPPPRAQTRPPPLQEQTGLETQLRLESQVYFSFSFFFLFFCITNIYLQCVRYASHDDDNRRPLPSTYEGPNDGLPSFGHRLLLLLLLLCKLTNMFLLDTTIFFPNTPRPPRAVTRAQTTVNPPRRV